ncbi:SRPBCC family protein [Phenylobacterium sp.]|uniref:SRPBCC family protein n=1 Tax=Phenylobacterium sp. TaxID=1871053 RepID=UPI0025D20EDC|nr:SRPBCC family protein [Phenylobacterium sp.]
MSDEEHVKAAFSRVDGQVQALMRRRFDHLTVSVWSMLTDAARLPLWLAPGAIEPRLGGAVRLDFADSGTIVDSTVTAYAPGRLLEYSWSGPGEPTRPVRWQLAPDGDGTVLTLTLRVPEGEDAGRACAGWEAHLEMLEAALEGVPIKFPFETFKAWRDAYRAELAQA